ncbi:MAG: ABC transporter permease [Hyphomicrobiaceae bacterium]|nr:ABC transporter permease [Hyphomicrobiaceae bacterium]
MSNILKTLQAFFDYLLSIQWTFFGCNHGVVDVTIIRLAIQSLRNRWLTAFLSVMAIAFSVTLMLSIEKIRTGAKSSFINTVSGTDMIIGARSGGIQLLLYSVFRIGSATNNMTWRSYLDISRRSEVDWIIPLSLGDSHRGFRVLGTTQAYFDRYKYRRGRNLVFSKGERFTDLFDAVVGADVASALGYKVNDKIIIAHGVSRVSMKKHDDKPFRISGILTKTGTPVDRTVHVSLEAIEAIHVDWKGRVQTKHSVINADKIRNMKLRPQAITAAMVGLKSKLAIFKLQHYVNSYRSEPLSAILPGATLYELWNLVEIAETALMVASVMVVVTAILGMMTMILATINERRREIAILRSVGAGSCTVVGLLVSEAGILTFTGVLLGVFSTYALIFLLRPFIDIWYGLYISISAPSLVEFGVLTMIIASGIIAGLLPALRACQHSLADGMIIRI